MSKGKDRVLISKLIREKVKKVLGVTLELRIEDKETCNVMRKDKIA